MLLLSSRSPPRHHLHSFSASSLLLSCSLSSSAIFSPSRSVISCLPSVLSVFVQFLFAVLKLLPSLLSSFSFSSLSLSSATRLCLYSLPSFSLSSLPSSHSFHSHPAIPSLVSVSASVSLHRNCSNEASCWRFVVGVMTVTSITSCLPRT